MAGWGNKALFGVAEQIRLESTMHHMCRKRFQCYHVYLFVIIINQGLGVLGSGGITNTAMLPVPLTAMALLGRAGVSMGTTQPSGTASARKAHFPVPSPSGRPD